MLAAELNELGIFHQQSQVPAEPPRNNRQSSSASGKSNSAAPTSGNHHQQIINPLDPIESSDSDSEPEESNERGRNDGTLLASDPPKPL